MKAFVLGSVLLLASACSGTYLGHAVSTQFQAHDGHGGYSYGYADHNSQKHETKDAHGNTHGGYSYVDGDGHLQTVKYTADPVHGFHVSATNLPKGPAPVAPVHHAAAEYHGHYASPWAHSYPALGHDGSPIETHEVQAAKAAHFAAHAAAHSRLHKRSTHYGYVPVDTPEVSAAKAAHFAAHAAVKSGYGPAAPVASHWDHHHEPAQKWHGPLHFPVIHKGVPVEPKEVQHARAAHAAAYAKVGSGYAPAGGEYHHGGAAPSYGAWHGPQHVPVIHNGVPVETPEVQHAKAAHLNALASAGAGSHYGGGAGYSSGHEDDGSYKPELWERHDH